MLAFGALVVVGGVLALFLALRQGDVPRRQGEAEPAALAAAQAGDTRGLAAERAVASESRTARPRPVGVAPAKPEVLGTTGKGDRPLWSSYDTEERDPTWATEKEGAVRSRLGPLLDGANHDNPGAVSVPQIECRDVHCRLLVTGTDKRAFMAFVESLQDERGFYGDAALLALDGYGETVDKRTGRPVQQVRVFLKYDR
jgi:hypothetical protein